MKSLAAFLLGLGIGIGTTAMVGWGFFSSPVSESEWKSLQSRTQAQMLEIEQQKQELEARAKTIQRIQTVAVAPSSTQMAATPAPKPKPANSKAAGLAALMDNPAMRKMMAAQQTRMIEENYADLIEQFHFTPEERAQFVRLLSDKQQIQMEAGFQMMKLSPEERSALRKETKTNEDAADAAIKEFFNDEKDYTAYTDYTKAQVENYEMKALRPAMKFAGQPLTSEQEKSLQEIMKAKRLDLAPTGDDEYSAPDATNINRLVEEQTRRNEQILADAARILSPEQLEVLRKTQASQVQMMKVGAEMSKTMFEE